ncbi:ketosamine-3-kinase isoform X2 [Antennarius striatus]|uniref:ketosamine-3-kinase isoform X2 n=1 Tax=Antennarius striatus TaxID=241820 RepID=UPI0035AFC13C
MYVCTSAIVPDFVLTKSMKAKLKKELGTTVLKSAGQPAGGCISEGQSYHTDTGKVFVKTNHKSEAKLMFDGEKASLEAILRTETVKVPKPLKVIELDTGGCVFVMEHLDIRGLSKYSKQLGEQMADLHYYNQRQLEKSRKEQQTENEWDDDWVTFYSRQRLQHQLGLVEKSYGDREARELWAELQLKIPQFFKEVEIVPALLHGDLWGGNVAESTDGPVIFDPASFYGHSEFELSISGMFGGFNNCFYSAYHEKIPQAPGFAKRKPLYQLFHYLNHWNHFGGSYRGSSIKTMKDLLK